jgi:hypothetical protein
MILVKKLLPTFGEKFVHRAFRLERLGWGRSIQKYFIGQLKGTHAIKCRNRGTGEKRS